MFRGPLHTQITARSCRQGLYLHKRDLHNLALHTGSRTALHPRQRTKSVLVRSNTGSAYANRMKTIANRLSRSCPACAGSRSSGENLGENLYMTSLASGSPCRNSVNLKAVLLAESPCSEKPSACSGGCESPQRHRLCTGGRLSAPVATRHACSPLRGSSGLDNSAMSAKGLLQSGHGIWPCHAQPLLRLRLRTLPILPGSYSHSWCTPPLPDICTVVAIKTKVSANRCLHCSHSRSMKDPGGGYK